MGSAGAWRAASMADGESSRGMAEPRRDDRPDRPEPPRRRPTSGRPLAADRRAADRRPGERRRARGATARGGDRAPIRRPRSRPPSQRPRRCRRRGAALARPPSGPTASAVRRESGPAARRAAPVRPPARDRPRAVGRPAVADRSAAARRRRPAPSGPAAGATAPGDPARRPRRPDDRPTAAPLRPSRPDGAAHRRPTAVAAAGPARGAATPSRPIVPRSAAVDTSGLVGEDEELIAGRRPVEEAFAARREAVRLLIVPSDAPPSMPLALHATTLRIPVVEVEGGSLTALAGFDGHQGVALVAEPRRPADHRRRPRARAAQRDEPPFVLVLDSLEDPQNFGTLLRSAEACGCPRRHLPDPPRGAAQPGGDQGVRRARPSTCCWSGRRPAGHARRPPWPRAAHRRRRRGGCR